MITVRKYQEADLPGLIRIWNQVVEDGIAYPQVDLLTEETGGAFFARQTYVGAAIREEDGRVVGLYILHPNNEGRCGHICNASYAVDREIRGEHIGGKLVSDSLVQARAAGFRIIQFNAVVATNIHARHLYERLGFTCLGTIPGGFHMPDGHYEDICIYYRSVLD